VLPLQLVDGLQGASGIVIVVVAVLAVFLAVLAVLMPYFVWQIHGNIERMRQLAEGGRESLAGASSGLDIVILTTLEEIRDTLKANASVTPALAEQQRTINALRRRLDELEGRSQQQRTPGEPGGEFAPPVPLGEAAEDDDVEPNT